MSSESLQRKESKASQRSPSAKNAAEASASVDAEAAVLKPKRVRTGCLTCRERHLKCDEGVPICQNCTKSSRKCKRGVRLNFIDIDCRPPPHLLPRAHDWKITFEDNSREIASEYTGGIEKYAVLEPPRKRRRLSASDQSFDYRQTAAPTMQHQQLPQHAYQGYDQSPAAIYNGNQSYADTRSHSIQYGDQQRQNYDQSLMMQGDPEPPGPPLTDRDEVLYMQVFVEEVGLWMDSLNKDKQFSRHLPFQALKEPMLRYALLACGVRHLNQVNSQQYPEEHALNYYNQSTQLLLKCLQNPNRDTALCATTATVLNVYETMSEKALQRMNHIAGARALIKECRWDGTSTGIGSACFWLNVGMEVYSCLRFNWSVAWDPDTWNIDMAMNPEHMSGNEEDWQHKMMWIMAKVANFKSTVPRFQEQNVHAEQLRVQTRYQQWITLKQLCDRWDKCVPYTMHAVAQVPGYSNSSSFPEVWYIKRATIIARLFYHTNLTILGGVHPLADSNPQLAEEMLQMRTHHARQVCGIVAHVKDRGVATGAIRSLAIAAEVLTIRKEQEEILEICERIKKEMGWHMTPIIDELKEKYGWTTQDYSSLNSSFFQVGTSNVSRPPSMPKPRGGIVNPLYKNADFNLQNHPYQGSWVPPASGYLQQNTHMYSFNGITAM